MENNTSGNGNFNKIFDKNTEFLEGTLPETISSPLKISHPKMKRESIPTMLVSGRVDLATPYVELHVSVSPLMCPTISSINSIAGVVCSTKAETV